MSLLSPLLWGGLGGPHCFRKAVEGRAVLAAGGRQLGRAPPTLCESKPTAPTRPPPPRVLRVCSLAPGAIFHHPPTPPPQQPPPRSQPRGPPLCPPRWLQCHPLPSNNAGANRSGGGVELGPPPQSLGGSGVPGASSLAVVGVGLPRDVPQFPPPPPVPWSPLPYTPCLSFPLFLMAGGGGWFPSNAQGPPVIPPPPQPPPSPVQPPTCFIFILLRIFLAVPSRSLAGGCGLRHGCSGVLGGDTHTPPMPSPPHLAKHPGTPFPGSFEGKRGCFVVLKGFFSAPPPPSQAGGGQECGRRPRPTSAA